MPKKVPVKSSSPPSSPDTWVDDAQDLNKMLAATQRKVNDQHHQLALAAMADAKAHVKDFRERALRANTSTYKDELNQVSSNLCTAIKEQNALLKELYAELNTHKDDVRAIVAGLLDGFQKDVENADVIGVESGKIIEQGFNDESKSIEVLKLALEEKTNPATAD